MNIEEYRDYCFSLGPIEEGTPFGENILVFKIGGKMFALTDIADFESINLKCKPEKAEQLRSEYEGVTSGYHMNKKHWNTVSTDGSISDNLLKEWIKDSYDLVVASLPKKTQKELREN